MRNARRDSNSCDVDVEGGGDKELFLSTLLKIRWWKAGLLNVRGKSTAITSFYSFFIMSMLCNNKGTKFIIVKNICSVLLLSSRTYFRKTFEHKPCYVGVPVPTAWRVLGLRMEERPPAMEVSCEYIE
jgi:hypothetical protein